MWGPRHSSVTEESEGFKVTGERRGCGCGWAVVAMGGGCGRVERISSLSSTILRICEPCPVLLAVVVQRGDSSHRADNR